MEWRYKNKYESYVMQYYLIRYPVAPSNQKILAPFSEEKRSPLQRNFIQPY